MKMYLIVYTCVDEDGEPQMWTSDACSVYPEYLIPELKTLNYSPIDTGNNIPRSWCKGTEGADVSAYIMKVDWNVNELHEE